MYLVQYFIMYNKYITFLGGIFATAWHWQTDW